MEFYKRLIIKILEKSSVGSDNRLLEKLKSGYDLTQREMNELENLYPQKVFHYFSEISKIPRGSKREKKSVIFL